MRQRGPCAIPDSCSLFRNRLAPASYRLTSPTYGLPLPLRALPVSAIIVPSGRPLAASATNESCGPSKAGCMS